MRKQMIIKVPEKATDREISYVLDNITQSYCRGYPLIIFPGWEYEIVELTEPVLVISEPKEKIKRNTDFGFETKDINEMRIIND